MKTYELFFYNKQGDDFSGYIERTKTTSEALRAWGADLKKCTSACEKIARVLDGKKISVTADTHMISFAPEDKAAASALEALAAENLLTASEIDDEE